MKQNNRVVFIAETITDLGKAAVVVSLAGYFFEKLPMFWRITATVSSILFMLLGIIIYPEGAER
jgi:hypothetical protein